MMLLIGLRKGDTSVNSILRTIQIMVGEKEEIWFCTHSYLMIKKPFSLRDFKAAVIDVEKHSASSE